MQYLLVRQKRERSGEAQRIRHSEPDQAHWDRLVVITLRAVDDGCEKKRGGRLL